MTIRSTIIFCAVILLLMGSCADQSESGSVLRPSAGSWQMLFSIDSMDTGIKVPVRMEIDSLGKWTIVNWTERIVLDSVSMERDSFHVKIPYFNSFLHGRVISADSMSGKWIDMSRKDYAIPFVASKKKVDEDTYLNAFKRTYDVTFSPDSEADRYKAVGIFEANGSNLCGTFLTESGDYRYLQGEIGTDASEKAQRISLSCFDGTHLFYFTGNLKGDSIRNGMFYSGKHWSEPWQGKLDPAAHLKDPDSLTYLRPEFKDFAFQVKRFNGDSLEFNQENLKGNVTIIQIFGSWCPNCSDESVFVSELYKAFSGKGLKVIPVAFERTDDFQRNAIQVKRQFEELGLPYEPFYGGRSGKDDAGKVFPMLSKVMSFPTMVILDKNARVRKIHTGFYGPGTGEYYISNTTRLRHFIEQLLEE